MKSVVGNSKPQRFADLNFALKNKTDNLESKHGMEYYFVSDLAIEQSDSVLYSLKDNRFDNKATDILVKTAFALGIESDYVESKVVSGLPVSHYSIYKDAIQNLFINKVHNFDVKDNGVSLKGSVRVDEGKFIPQPFGALLDRVLADDGSFKDKALASKVVAVIDVGFGTSDIYVADALSPVERLTFSTKTAMNHSYNLIANKIEEKFDVMLPLYAVEKIARSGEFKKSGKIYDMKPIIQWANKLTSQQLVAEITNKWKTIHEIDHILLTGGGGIALSNYTLPEFENIELLDDTQWAVVNGYYKWGVKNFAKTIHI